MKKSKWISLLLAGILTLSLAGCGGGNTADTAVTGGAASDSETNDKGEPYTVTMVLKKRELKERSMKFWKKN